jgi:hypothetical protein
METLKHYLISLLLSFVAMLISMMMGLGDFMVGFFTASAFLHSLYYLKDKNIQD